MSRFFDEPQAKPSPAQLAAEIAARLVEWAEIASQSAVSDWLKRLALIHRADPPALWLYLAWQTGDSARIAASFEEQGDRDAKSRQAVQQQAERAFAALKRVAPELAQAMRETFEAHAPEAEKSS